ncbi:hypothetical protein [Halorubrum sp. CBA1125]|uniref:WD40/YVTN/BNR-like repeat-containing protein n=1 Tax=Halorubrum sp. CBA1125 TaxID=2668072 RepID=UPI002AA2B107|nr:hypothetical protein [Halorubrum sp. CBA1125]
MYRSADGAVSWVEVQNLTQQHVWSWDENNAGEILAVERKAQEILTSNDDGQSWSSFATISTDFPEFSDHIHKAAYHPVNDNIIVTGGDGPDYFYRSTDGGSTWDEFAAHLGQYVAIAPDPTDGSIYYLGHDKSSTSGDEDFGVVRVEDGGGSSVTQTMVQSLNPELRTGIAAGSFSIHTVYDEGSGRGYYLASTLEQESNLLLASTSLQGSSWRAIGATSHWTGQTTTPSAYQTVNLSETKTAVGGDISVNIVDAANPLYGTPADLPIEKRGVRDTLTFRDNESRIRHSGDASFVDFLYASPNESDDHVLRYGFGGWILRNQTAGRINFKLNDDGLLELREGEVVTQQPGDGLRVTTPDGSAEYRIRVDDSGNVVTDQL